MKLFVCAGEPSGDQHAAGMVRELKALQPGLAVTAIGGPALADVGARLLADLTAIAPIGVVEVLKDLGTYRQALLKAEGWCAAERPDAAVLLDFPDFNLRLARRLKRLGIRVVYYISPQVWAWRPGRVRGIARVVDRMLVLFDFEEGIYRKAGVDVRWVGHPLVEQIPDPGTVPREAGLVGLLPGSRSKEVARLLPVLAGAAVRISTRPGTRFVVAPTPSVPFGLVKDILVRAGVEAEVRPGGARDLMRSAELLLIASGTATLEAALYGTPMVVVYKVNPLTAMIGRALIDMKEFALANILSGGGTVPECIQGNATPEAVAREALALLGDPARRAAMRARLGAVRAHVGPPGASRRAAEAVLEIARKGHGS